MQVRSKRKKALAKSLSWSPCLIERKKWQVGWKLVKIMKTYKCDKGNVRVINFKTSSGISRRNFSRVVPLLFYNSLGQPLMPGEIFWLISKTRKRMFRLNSTFKL